MFAQDSSRKLGISNGSHFITHLRKCQPLKNVLIINNCNLALRFQINFCKFDSIGGLKLTDCVSHQLCQLAIITENLGVNIFSSSQPLYMLPIPNCGEIIQPIKTYFWLSTTKWKHILWMKWWLILKISYLWGLFLASIKCKMNISAAIFFIFSKFWFFRFLEVWVKVQKMTHDYEFQSVTLYISRTVDHIIKIFDTQV